jgi:hypothetical protein
MKKSHLIVFFIVSILFSCANNKEVPTGKPMSVSKSGTTSCQLIVKEFENKGGKVTEYKELYLRCSIQDYFIKLCEGNVSAEQLKPYINSGIEVEMEIRNGIWDHCNENPAYTQSRTGPYVIIKSIIK